MAVAVFWLVLLTLLQRIGLPQPRDPSANLGDWYRRSCFQILSGRTAGAKLLFRESTLVAPHLDLTLVFARVCAWHVCCDNLFG